MQKMADNLSKEDKLNLARKKLRKFQEKKKAAHGPSLKSDTEPLEQESSSSFAAFEHNVKSEFDPTSSQKLSLVSEHFEGTSCKDMSENTGTTAGASNLFQSRTGAWIPVSSITPDIATSTSSSSPVIDSSGPVISYPTQGSTSSDTTGDGNGVSSDCLENYDMDNNSSTGTGARNSYTSEISDGVVVVNLNDCEDIEVDSSNHTLVHDTDSTVSAVIQPNEVSIFAATKTEGKTITEPMQDYELEIKSLKEQHQIHLQTISILVEEKSQLQGSVERLCQSLTEKSTELHSTKTELNDLNAGFRNLKSENEKLTEQNHENETVINTLTSHNREVMEKNSLLIQVQDEIKANLTELQERLTDCTDQNTNLKKELDRMKNIHQMDQVYLEQLRHDPAEGMKEQYDEAKLTINLLQNQIELSKSAYEQIRNEMKRMENDYREYTNGLVKEIESLKLQLNKPCESCEIAALKLKEKEAFDKNKNNAEKAEQETQSEISRQDYALNELQAKIETLNNEKAKSEHQITILSSDNSRLSQIISQQNLKMESLENAADRSKTESVDTSHLLQVMQSDKVAASRAMSQNKQLKEQLAELQDGFVMMSNKKLELSEKLEREIHLKNSLNDKLCKLENEIEVLKREMNERNLQLERMMIAKEQKDANLSVQKGSEKVESLLVSNDDSKNSENVHSKTSVSQTEEKQNIDIPVSQHLNKGSTEISSQTEISDAKVSSQTEIFDAKVSSQTEIFDAKVSSQTEISASESASETKLKSAFYALEKRFLKSMDQVAHLNEEKQRLESLVQKLQMESEAVCDYITIYQFQRSIMKQRMREVQTELEMLRNDRQDVYNKLSKLQSLFQDLPQNYLIKKMTEKQEDVSNDNETALSQSKKVSTPDIEGNVEDREKLDNSKINKIIEIIKDIEQKNPLDNIDLNNLHLFTCTPKSCPQCSGKMITV